MVMLHALQSVHEPLFATASIRAQARIVALLTKLPHSFVVELGCLLGSINI